MVFYDESIKKDIKKGILPKAIAELFNKTFIALDKSKDLNLFDIKKLITYSSIDYFRFRKGKYRAIFYIEKGDLYVVTISKRAEVYKKWQ